MDGYETARRIRGEPWGADVRLFALTGWGQEDARRRSQEAGFDRHFVKPVDPTALMRALEQPVPGGSSRR
jgi:CheY-like chemotaxis protein